MGIGGNTKIIVFFGWIQGIRHSATMTTLPLGIESPPSVNIDFQVASDCDQPMHEYVFGHDPNMVSESGNPEDLALSKLKLWISVRGPRVQPDQAPGHVEQVSKIWGMLHKRELLLEDRLKIQRDVENQCQKLEQAKELQVTKWVGQFGSVDPQKMVQVEEWHRNKRTELLSRVDAPRVAISDIEKSIDASLRDLLMKLKPPNTVQDPVCEQYMNELEGLFENMNINMNSVPQPDPTPPLVGQDHGDLALDATKVAHQHVASLPDGPQKTALMAVLEAAVVAPQAWVKRISWEE